MSASTVSPTLTSASGDRDVAELPMSGTLTSMIWLMRFHQLWTAHHVSAGAAGRCGGKLPTVLAAPSSGAVVSQGEHGGDQARARCPAVPRPASSSTTPGMAEAGREAHSRSARARSADTADAGDGEAGAALSAGPSLPSRAFCSQLPHSATQLAGQLQSAFAQILERPGRQYRRIGVKPMWKYCGSVSHRQASCWNSGNFLSASWQALMMKASIVILAA